MPTASKTFLDVVNMIGWRCGDIPELTTLTDPDRPTKALLDAINEVMHLIHRVRPAMEIQALTSLNTVAPISTGTAAIAQGSTAAVGTDTAWDGTMIGRAISFGGTVSVHRIVSVEDATHLTIDVPFPGDPIINGTYTIAQDEYALPSNFHDFVGDLRVSGMWGRHVQVRRISDIDALRSYHSTSPLLCFTPAYASVREGADTKMMVLHPFPDRIYQILYRYTMQPAEMVSGDDIVPLEDASIGILIGGAVALWQSIQVPEMPMAYIRWQEETLPLALAQDQRMTQEVPRIIPDDTTRSRNWRSYGRIDWKDR